jgi:RNA polymerase sigma-70 factor (ECF subfamily)
MSPAPQQVSDEELARQTQAGSLQAFEELVLRYQGRIYRFVRNFCRADADAREVTQDAFVRAYQAIAQFDTSQAFAGWLFAIARRKCIDHHRSARPVSDATPPDATDDEDPAAQLARREDAKNLWQVARRHLPEIQFQALWLKYVDDLGVAEIARALGKTQTHIKVLLFRSRQVLATKLKTTSAESSLGEHSGHAQSPCAAINPLKNPTITPVHSTG